MYNKQRSGLCPSVIACVLFCVLVSGACSKQGTGEDIGRSVVISIHNDPLSALSARLEISSAEPVDAEVRYRQQGSTPFVSAGASTGKMKHRIGLFPLKEKTVYEVEISLRSSADASSKAVRTERFTTAAVPASVSSFYQVTKPMASTGIASGHYLFASMSSPSTIYIIDQQGELIWYQTMPHVVKSVHLTDRQTILSIQDDNATPFGDGNIVLEQSLTGDTLFHLRHGQRGFDKWVHHDLKRDKDGNIVAITNVFKDNKPGDGLVKWSSAGNKLWEWTTFDVAEELDPDLREQPWINSLYIDDDGHYLISLRAIDQVWKVDAQTGKVHWKLGKNGDIPLNGTDQFLKQHYAHRSASGDLMLFDNGDASRPYSRVRSFVVDAAARIVQQKMDIRLPSAYYSPIMGSARLLPAGHILLASSSTNHALRIDSSGEILWILKTTGPIYRIEYLDGLFSK